jgi:hypothetical protein
MTGNFLLSTIEQRFHYPTLLVTQCVKVALNFSQIADSLLGLIGGRKMIASETADVHVHNLSFQNPII